MNEKPEADILDKLRDLHNRSVGELIHYDCFILIEAMEEIQEWRESTGCETPLEAYQNRMAEYGE